MPGPQTIDPRYYNGQPNMMPSMPMMPSSEYVEYEAPISQIIQAPPQVIERQSVIPYRQFVPPAYTQEPEYMEHVVEIPRINVEHRERLVEVPQPQVVDRIIEVPQIQEVVKVLPPAEDEMHTVYSTRECPVVEFRDETLPPMEVAQVQYQDRYVEVPQIQEVLRVIPRIEVREIPIERIIQVPKKVIQEIEQPIFRPVPHLIQQAVEREIPVPKVQVQQVEVVKQISQPMYEEIEVMVPQPFPSYELTPGPMMEVMEVPVPQPYPVIEEKEVEVYVPQVQERFIEKIVEVPIHTETTIEVPVEVPVLQPAPRELPAQPFPVPMPYRESTVVHEPISFGLPMSEHTIVHDPVVSGPPVAVSSRILGVDTLPTQTSMVSTQVPIVKTASVVQPRVTTTQVLAPREMAAGSLPMASTTIPRERATGGLPMASTTIPMSSQVIGPGQRVGTMTPPTPPIGAVAPPFLQQPVSGQLPVQFQGGIPGSVPFRGGIPMSGRATPPMAPSMARLGPMVA
jgi:hypothetical protein